MSHNIVVPGGTTVLLPTAGKYCDRDILVTAEGGSLSLDVVTASTLPGTVVDGQIVVITDTTPGTVYIDTDEPAAPAAGDVWAKLEAGADVALELTEETPYLRGGLVNAAQWDGTVWSNVDAYLGLTSSWEQFSYSLPPVGQTLNEMSWADIAKIAESGKGAEYFSVGDRKAVEISGKVGSATVSGTYYCTIIGINHNKKREGNGIHFQFVWTALSGGTAYAFDYSYSGSAVYIMNTDAKNNGGWEDSYMRNTTCPAFLSILPAELQAVIKPCKKYTDNVGQGGDASAVTETTDSIFLMSQYEAFGSTSGSNGAEADYQEQYAYYAAGNSRVKNRLASQSNKATWWLRSPGTATSNGFRAVGTDGAGSTTTANKSYGFAPCFMV